MSDDGVRRPKPRLLDPNYEKTKRSKAHENRIAAAFGGKRLPASGAKFRSKWDAMETKGGGIQGITARGDVGTPDLHIEHKRTDNASMSIKLEWLLKVKGGAKDALKDPCLVITFDRPGQNPEDWAMVPMSVLQRLLGRPTDD